MSQPVNDKESLFSYPVWDRSVRIFHWINVISITGLICLGLGLLYDDDLGLSKDGKILFKTIHAYIGYVFIINLAWRLIWGFFGNRYARWKGILPFGKGYKDALSAYISGLKDGTPPPYAGHNPLARLMVTLMFLLLIIQGSTGLLLAGTDLYLPPFGHEIAEWVTGAGEDQTRLESLKPGSKEGIDPQAYKEMRAFRKPFVETHETVFYILIIAILLHILGVIVTEYKEKSGLVSAMLTGEKVFTKKPLDSDNGE